MVNRNNMKGDERERKLSSDCLLESLVGSLSVTESLLYISINLRMIAEFQMHFQVLLVGV